MTGKGGLKHTKEEDYAKDAQTIPICSTLPHNPHSGKQIFSIPSIHKCYLK